MARDLPQEDPLIRMQRDLKRALKKNPKDIKWGMVIDIAKCIGCHASTIGCVAENKLPPGVVYRVVLEEDPGTIPLWGGALCPGLVCIARILPASRPVRSPPPGKPSRGR